MVIVISSAWYESVVSDEVDQRVKKPICITFVQCWPSAKTLVKKMTKQRTKHFHVRF